MKNLKQVLALGMAFSLSLSTMAGAAFTDQSSIKNTEAVDMLTNLSIIKGYEDGSFKPEGTVTRAEMAKMIYTIRNGGNDDASAYESVTTSFTDISGHWAEGYIKYLQNTGIVAGKSATTFAPDDTVTTAEAMKMALVLAGYRADKANLTGAEWLNNTVSLATTNKLTDQVTSAMAGPCTRQNAAQILANALEMTAVQWSEFVNGFVNDSDTGLAMSGDKITVGYKWMDLTTYVGRMVSSGDLAIDGNGTAGNNQFKVDADTVNNVDADKALGSGKTLVTFKDGKDHTDLVGQEVKILTGDKIDEVYGVYATGTSKVVETTMDKVDVDGSNNKLKVDGTSYSVNYDNKAAGDKTDVYTDTKGVSTVADIFTSNGKAVSDNVKLIDWDNNGKYETVLVETANVAEITYVGTDSITVGQAGGRDTTVLNNQRVFDNDEIEIYEGAAKGDYVVITRDDYNTDNWKIEKATVVTGTVDGVVKNERKVRVDGTWYTLANDKTGAKSDDKDLYAVSDSKKDFVNKDQVTLYVVGDIAYYAESTKGNDVNRSVAMVYDTNEKGGNWNNTAQAKIILPDGTKKTVDIASDSAVGCTSLNAGQMYYYTVNNDDEYSFTKLGGSVTAGYDSYVSDTDGVESNNTYGGRMIADDAVVFAAIEDNGKITDAKVYTGKAVKDAVKGTNWGANANGGALIEENNGFTYTRMMNITLPKNAQISSATNYGYLVTDATYSYNSELRAYVMEYSYWNGTEVVNVKEKTSANKTWAVKGTVISFANGDEAGLIKDVTDVQNASVDADKLTYASITGANKQYVSFQNTDGTTKQAEVASDVLIYYVNSDASKDNQIGVSGSGYDYVVQDINGVYKINAGYVLNSDGKVKFMVIDVDGELNNQSQNRVNVMSTNSTATQINDALKNSNVAINGNITVTGTALSVPSSRTLTVNGTLAIDAMPTVSGTLKAKTIDATAISDISASDVEKLMTYADSVKVSTVKGDLTVNSGTLDITTSIDGKLTINGGTVTVAGADASVFAMVAGAVRSTPVVTELVVNGGTVAVKGDVTTVAIKNNAKVAVDGAVTTLTIDSTVTAAGTSIEVTGNVDTLTNNSSVVNPTIKGDVTTNNGSNTTYSNGADTKATKVTL